MFRGTLTLARGSRCVAPREGIPPGCCLSAFDILFCRDGPGRGSFIQAKQPNVLHDLLRGRRYYSVVQHVLDKARSFTGPPSDEVRPGTLLKAPHPLNHRVHTPSKETISGYTKLIAAEILTAPPPPPPVIGPTQLPLIIASAPRHAVSAAWGPGGELGPAWASIRGSCQLGVGIR